MIALYKIGLSIVLGAGAAILIEGKNGNEKHGKNCRNRTGGNGGIKPRPTSSGGNRRSGVANEKLHQNRNDHTGDSGTGEQRAATPLSDQAKRIGPDELDTENGPDSGGNDNGGPPASAGSVISDGNNSQNSDDK